MKSLTQHILERRHVNDSVVLLFNHIYGKLEELVNQPAQDPMFNNETRLYELFLENDKEYDIVLLAEIILIGILINSVSVGATIFPQPRYMAYGMGLFFFVLFLEIFKYVKWKPLIRH